MESLVDIMKPLQIEANLKMEAAMQSPFPFPKKEYWDYIEENISSPLIQPGTVVRSNFIS